MKLAEDIVTEKMLVKMLRDSTNILEKVELIYQLAIWRQNNGHV